MLPRVMGPSLGNTIFEATILLSVTFIMIQFVAFTMDIYSHIISGIQEEAMALLDGVMPAGIVSENPALKWR